MEKHIECVVPGCSFKASAPTEDALLKKVTEHAKQDHHLTGISPELLADVKAAIVTK